MSYRKGQFQYVSGPNEFLAGPATGTGPVEPRVIVGSDISAALAELGVTTGFGSFTVADLGKVLTVTQDGTLDPALTWELPFPSQTALDAGAVLVAGGDNTVSWGFPTLSFTGDVSGSGTLGSAIDITIADSGVVAGTYLGITVDSRGIVTAADGSLPSNINFGSYEAGSTNIATLDVNGKVPFTQLPSDLLGSLKFMGVFDISTETLLPSLPQVGDYWLVSGVGSQPDGSENYTDIDDNPLNLKLKDLILFSGAANEWVKIDNTEQVVSVNGKTGAVVLGVADISGAASTADLATLQASLQSADATLAADILAESNARSAADATLAADLSAEESARIAADATLAADISAEAGARAAEDLVLHTLISNLSGSISGDLSAAIATLQADLSLEESARNAADVTLAADLSAEEAARIAADATLAADLAAEESARIAAVATLSTDLSAEEAARIAEDLVLHTLISDLSASVSGDLSAAISTLQADLSLEEAARIAADATLAADLAAEESARIAAVATLSADLGLEETARIAADATLSADLAQEVIDRAAADATLLATIQDTANVAAITVKTADYQMVASDSTVAVNMTGLSADVTITLPETPRDGQVVNIKRLDDAVAFDVIVDGFGAVTIDGEATQLIKYAWSSLTLQFSSTLGYWVIL